MISYVRRVEPGDLIFFCQSLSNGFSRSEPPNSTLAYYTAERSFAGTEKPSIASLAKQISELSLQISSYLSSSSQLESNFSASSTVIPETAEYEALCAPLNDAVLDLLRLINGPKSSLRSFFFSHYDLAALQAALDRGFFSHVPLMTPIENRDITNRNEAASIKQITE
jgi:hypothetical protein